MTGETMPLWLLRPALPPLDDAWTKPRAAHGFVVQARHAAEARELVALRSDELVGPGSEGYKAWLDPSRTDCVLLRLDGPPRVVLRDFREGSGHVERDATID